MKKLYNWFLNIQHWQYIAVLIGVYDVFTICLSWVLAVALRFDFRFSEMIPEFGSVLLRFLPVYSLACLLIYGKMKLYNSIWRYASYIELQRISIATVFCWVSAILVTFIFQCRLPVSAYVTGIAFQFFFTCILRFSYRYILLLKNVLDHKAVPRRKAMIIGAGAAGQMLLKDAQNSEFSDLNVVCFIDDNPNKHNRFIDQIPVVGDRNDILKAAADYEIEVILYAVPSADAANRRDILNICQSTDCELRVLPSLIQLATGQVDLKNLRKIRMEDLLGRESVKVNTEGILQNLSSKRVLVTGAGGSIGSELARQIADHQPEQLILIDIYENNIYDVQNELKRKNKDLNLVVLIASVRDSARVNQIFEQYKPQIVFHAAAHKHVPLMETSPCESIKNNVFGTYKVAQAAITSHSERFVLISTDKAVNPTNIMGATKRICEMIIQSANIKAVERAEKNGDKPTQFVAVRFGNVLGSNGSVIPLFQKQIENGGPVTVTHPDIVRYFMTISEAVSLILEAETYARGGEIFVLDMGAPVRIDDLARNLIRMAGKVPDQDIQVEYTGLRPGEKLYEEKLMEEEGLQKTENELIHIGKPIDFDREDFLDKLPELYNLAMKNQNREVIEMVVEIVRTYSPDWQSFVKNGVISDVPEEPVSDSQSVSDHELMSK